MRRRANKNMPFGPIHRSRLAVSILNAESATRVGPFNILKLVADNSAGPALDTAFIGEEDVPIILRRVTGGGATIDALLANTFEARVGINDADVSPRSIDVIGIERQLSFNCGWIEDVSPLKFGFRPYGCGHVWHCPIMLMSAQCHILPRATNATRGARLASHSPLSSVSGVYSLNRSQTAMTLKGAKARPKPCRSNVAFLGEKTVRHRFAQSR
jgi:hypothetical protein